jgi:hypothetical protein
VQAQLCALQQAAEGQSEAAALAQQLQAQLTAQADAMHAAAQAAEESESQLQANTARIAELEAALAGAGADGEVIQQLNTELQELAEEVQQLRQQQAAAPECTPPPAMETPKPKPVTPKSAIGTPAPSLVELRWEISQLYQRLRDTSQAKQSAEQRLAAKQQVRIIAYCPAHPAVECWGLLAFSLSSPAALCIAGSGGAASQGERAPVSADSARQCAQVIC